MPSTSIPPGFIRRTRFFLIRPVLRKKIVLSTCYVILQLLYILIVKKKCDELLNGIKKRKYINNWRINLNGQLFLIFNKGYLKMYLIL